MSEGIDEVGIVVEQSADGRVAWVQCVKNSACQHCAAAAACGMDHEKSTRRIEVANPVGARPGDRVRFETSIRKFLQSSFILYGVPLAFLLAGALLGRALGAHLGQADGGNGLSALVGMVALGLSFGAIRLATRKVSKDSYMPVIVEILPPGETGGDGGCGGHGAV